jgi:hypothetical protein
VIVPAGYEEMTDAELVRFYVDELDFTEEQARAYVEVVRHGTEKGPVD